jgi:dihydroneopterin aldolase
MPPAVSLRDRIILSRIGVIAHHGIYKEEARLGHRFMISVTMALDLGAAGRNDDLSASVNYADFAAQVQDIAVSRRLATIEALAEAIATASLARHRDITEVFVPMEKPGAAIPAILNGIPVSIASTRVRGRHAAVCARQALPAPLWASRQRDQCVRIGWLNNKVTRAATK